MHMERTVVMGAMAVLLAAPVMLAFQAQGQAPAGGGPPAPPAMRLTTDAWPDGGTIPLKYTQAVPNPVSPRLTWTNVPPGTQSFVLHFHDPDVSRNKTTNDQVHWMFWNIPGTATGLPEGIPMGAQLPDGSRQISASGPVYRGPGAGAAGPMHHYTFEIYALDIVLQTQPGADEQETRAAVMRDMNGHILGKAVYVGLFRRPQ
jgi:Raf kinase inhibitor-like YbhB/YbcL family protein